VINRKVISGFLKVLENVDAGVMQYRIIGVLKRDINPLAITPVLQYSNTAKLIQLYTTVTLFWFIDPKQIDA
jgi:hypothetical protein